MQKRNAKVSIVKCGLAFPKEIFWIQHAPNYKRQSPTCKIKDPGVQKKFLDTCESFVVKHKLVEKVHELLQYTAIPLNTSKSNPTNGLTKCNSKEYGRENKPVGNCGRGILHSIAKRE